MAMSNFAIHAVMALVFAALGLLSRHSFQLTQSRLQIMLFFVLAFVCEALVCAIFGVTWSSPGWLIDGAAAAAGIIAMRWYLKGSPF